MIDRYRRFSGLAARGFVHPLGFAAVLVLLVSLAIVFGPSADTRFIYTDF